MYISPNGESGSISDRYERFQDYLKTGEDIEATEIVLHEKNGELYMGVTDGRHRFSVMRDMGMEKIKFAMDGESLDFAIKYGLVAKLP